MFAEYNEFGNPAAALCTRVRGIRRIRKSSGCILHTCSNNTTNLDLERQHFAYVFEEYDEFGARTAALCTRVLRIQQIRSSNGSTLHTCSKNTMNSELKLLHFARVREIQRILSSSGCVTTHPSSSLGQKLSKSCILSITVMY